MDNQIQPRKKGVIYVTKQGFTLFSVLVLGVIFLGTVGISSKIMAKRHNRISCLLFSSQQDAQNHFNSNPKLYAALDRNNNGKACEKYKY